jgi:hypothetical protein
MTSAKFREENLYFWWRDLKILKRYRKHYPCSFYKKLNNLVLT